MKLSNKISLAILAWHSYMEDPYCEGALHADSSAVSAAYRWLIEYEMLGHMNKGYCLTKKGEVFIEHLMTIPLPVSVHVWKVPACSQIEKEE